MEKHHKLRRPAGSSIHACNICGIEGHQAAQCTNGTVNWAQKWGRNAFKPTEGGSAGASKEPDYADLAAQARAFAAKRLADEQAAKKIAEEVGSDDADEEKDSGKAAKGVAAAAANGDRVGKNKDGGTGVKEDDVAGTVMGRKKRDREDDGGDDDGDAKGVLAKGAKIEVGAAARDAGVTEKKTPVLATQLPKASLPVPPAPTPAKPTSDWRVYYDQLGRPYYHNSVTGVTQWTPPVV